MTGREDPNASQLGRDLVRIRILSARHRRFAARVVSFSSASSASSAVKRDSPCPPFLRGGEVQSH